MLTTTKVNKFDTSTPLIQAIELTLDEAKSNAIARLHRQADVAYANYKAGYPSSEVETFDTRRAEALAYVKDSTLPTPVIDALIGFNPGLPEHLDIKAEHVQAVLFKAAAVAREAGLVIEFRDKIKACNTKEELEALTWP